MTEPNEHEPAESAVDDRPVPAARGQSGRGR